MRFYVLYVSAIAFSLAASALSCRDPVTPLPDSGDAAARVDSSVDPGFVVAPSCASACANLHRLGCSVGSDERKCGAVCTTSRGGSFDLREDCLARAQSVEQVRACCAAGETCTRVKCQ